MSGSASPRHTPRRHTSFPDLSDEMLLKRILEREPEALGVLYDRYSPLVYTAALCLTDDTTTAEAMVIVVFDTIWHMAASYCDEQTIEGWVLCITHHHVAPYTQGHLREQQPERDGTTQQQTTPGSQGMQVAPTVSVDLKGAALTPTERMLIALSYSRSLSPGRLALLLGEPVERVKIRLREGFFKLHTHLARGDNERTV